MTGSHLRNVDNNLINQLFLSYNAIFSRVLWVTSLKNYNFNKGAESRKISASTRTFPYPRGEKDPRGEKGDACPIHSVNAAKRDKL